MTFEMKRILKCRNCGEDLSLPVTIFDADSVEFHQPAFVDGEDVMRQGFVFMSRKPYRFCPEGPPDPLEFTPQYWMTMKDILENVHLTKDAKRLNGCCGLDGCDGPNRVCSCGAYVGTEMNDCWTSYLFVPCPSNTEWSDIK
jgi:hypothetical protein